MGFEYFGALKGLEWWCLGYGVVVSGFGSETSVRDGFVGMVAFFYLRL